MPSSSVWRPLPTPHDCSSGFAIAYCHPDGSVSGEWIGMSNPDALAGALGRLQRLIYAETD